MNLQNRNIYKHQDKYYYVVHYDFLGIATAHFLFGELDLVNKKINGGFIYHPDQVNELSMELIYKDEIVNWEWHTILTTCENPWKQRVAYTFDKALQDIKFLNGLKILIKDAVSNTQGVIIGLSPDGLCVKFNSTVGVYKYEYMVSAAKDAKTGVPIGMLE